MDDLTPEWPVCDLVHYRFVPLYLLTDIYPVNFNHGDRSLGEACSEEGVLAGSDRGGSLTNCAIHGNSSLLINPREKRSEDSAKLGRLEEKPSCSVQQLR